MSNSYLIQWFEQLLFGSSLSLEPPLSLKHLILRMEAEGIPWAHIIRQGGFTAFAYQIHGDLNYLIDSLEKQWLEDVPSHPVSLKTKAVTTFWNQLQLLLAKRDEPRLSPLPVPPEEDDAILRAMLESNHPGPFSFRSADFWGVVAQKLILLQRPDTPSALPPVCVSHWKRLQQLYDVTCVARGVFYDPLSLHLVHYSEYVNAVHWQSSRNLEAFMHDRPTHPLTLSIQALLGRTVEQVLHGEKPSVYPNPCSQLDALLHNIRVIHASVQQVPHENTPPKLIDVFPRLLALSRQDGLWEKEVPVIEPTQTLRGTPLLNLTERLRIAEREKRILWQHVTEREREFVREPPPHTCSTYLYAIDKPRPSFE